MTDVHTMLTRIACQAISRGKLRLSRVKIGICTMRNILKHLIWQPAHNHLVSLIQYPDFRNIWLAGIMLFAGMWVFIAAATWIAVEESGTSRGPGIIAFSSLIPFLLFSPVGGFLADRYNRRDIVLVCCVANTLLSILIAVDVSVGSLQLWHLALFAFFTGVFRTIMNPAVQALIPNQGEEKHVLNALTLYTATHHGSRFLGLLIAAPLLASGVALSISGVITVTGGVGTVLILSALLTGLSSIFASLCSTVSYGEIDSIHTKKQLHKETSYPIVYLFNRLRNVIDATIYFIRGMLAGIAFIYTNRIITIFIILVAFHCALVMSFESIMPIFSREFLAATDGSTLGYLSMSIGCGAIIGILLVSGITKQSHKGYVLLWSAIGSGIAPMLMALTQDTSLAMLFAGLMGASQASFMAITHVYVLTLTPDRLRGRVSSLYALHAASTMAFANLGYGFLADIFNARVIFIATGLIFVIFLVVISTSLSTLRKFYRTGQAPM